MRARHISIPKGDAGVRATVRHMRRIARKARYSPAIRFKALEIIRGVSGRDALSQISNIREWLDEHISFVRDPVGGELIVEPDEALELLDRGHFPLRLDCDDVAVLAAALAESIGLRARFVVVGFHSRRAPFRHVWTELAAPSRASRWYDMDVTRMVQGLPLNAISRRWIVEV